jgi:tRNA-intron endonuclease
MDGTLRDGEVIVGGDARQRFYDSRGYGRPIGGDRLALAPVEAAHLLYRGDLTAVDGLGFRGFLTARERTATGIVVRFLVYKDLRDRGFYLSPAREGWVDPVGAEDFVVYPRGQGPWDDAVAYRVRALGERDPVRAAGLAGGVLAVVDEESDLSYYEAAAFEPSGGTDYAPDPATGVLLDDRVVLWNPPADLHERGFYGRPLATRDGDGAGRDALHLSLVESAYLAADGALDLEDGGGVERLVERGRAVEGDRFDRRLQTYRALRDRGAAPKTGFKFGADFRVYEAVESAADLGHAEYLVRVLSADHSFLPRDLALDVRLAHGVRKRMIFARHAPSHDDERGAGDQIEWFAVSRLTP